MAEQITHEGFVKRLVDALNKGGIDYVLIGGIAAIYYGRFRSTQDCDIIISLEESQIKNFYESLKKAGFELSENDILMAFKEKSHFNAHYKDFIFFRADFSWRRGSLADRTFERARKGELFGVVTKMTSPEDLIIAKLVYGSPQDLEDAKAVIRKQRELNKLDEEYLKRRAEEEGMARQLEKLLKEASE